MAVTLPAWLLLANPQSSSTATMEQLAKMAGLAGTQELSHDICAGAPATASTPLEVTATCVKGSHR